MVELTVDRLSEINKNCLRAGENFSILDLNRLESAIGNQWAPYPMEEQAVASVFRSLIQNHPFENGNKRTAVIAAYMLADSIDRDIVLNDTELGDLVYKLADAGGSLISVNSIANQLFGLDLEEKLTEARKQSALKSNGIFSVLNNEWIKKPVAEDIPEIDGDAFDAELSKWESRYNELVSGVSFEENTPEEIVEKLTTTQRYYYSGPLYRFEDVFRRHWSGKTDAVSKKKAISNLNAQAKQAFGFTYDAKLNIDPNYVEILDPEDEIDWDVVADTRRCPHCGRELNDSGECPLCDLGDESTLDESIRSDKVEEIEDFIEDIYDLRKDSIANEGEYGIGNLVFKECRNRGYLDNLRDLRNMLKSKELSLESVNEHLSKSEIRDRVANITEDDVRSWINDKSGWDMTIDPDTLKRANLSDLPSGWIVTQNFGLSNIFNPKDYSGMTAFIKDVLTKYGDKYYIGTYKIMRGKNRGKIAIDVNRVIKDTKEAIEDGIKNAQESIFRYEDREEYLFLVHNLISRRIGDDKISAPFYREELKEYGLDSCIVDTPIENCMNIKLVDGPFNTNIPAKVRK